MKRIKFNCKRYNIYNVVFISGLNNEFIQKNHLIKMCSNYGQIKKIVSHKNTAHVEFYSIISAALCINYLNEFKLLLIKKKSFLQFLYKNMNIEFCTSLTKKDLKHEQILFELNEPIRRSKSLSSSNPEENIYPFVKEFERKNTNLIFEFFPNFFNESKEVIDFDNQTIAGDGDHETLLKNNLHYKNHFLSVYNK